VTVKKFSELSGYTEAAARTKISDGVWLEGREWKRAPDGRILMDIEGYSAWVESGLSSALPTLRSFSPMPPTCRKRKGY